MKSSELIVRIVKVCSGNVGIAVVSFFISILLLKLHGEEVFAIFSMFLVFSSLHLSVSNSSFLVPASRIDNSDEKNLFIKDCSLYFYLMSLVFSLVYALFLLLSKVPIELTCSFFILYLSYTIRGYIRAYAFVVKEYNKSLMSDVSFFVLVLLILVPSLILIDVSVSTFCLLFSGLCFISLLPFGFNYLENFVIKFVKPTSFAVLHSEKFSESKHSVIGVVYSEIVSNSHAYAIPLIFGIKNYAPVAAFFMLFRPFAIAAASFIQSERVQLIDSCRNGEPVNEHLIKLSKISFLLFLGNFIAAAFVLFSQKEIVINQELLVVFISCAVIILARNVKSVISLGLQVKGFFQLVTFISSKYVLLVPIFIFSTWLSGYTYSMVFFTMILEVFMFFDFYTKYRRFC